MNNLSYEIMKALIKLTKISLFSSLNFLDK